MSENQTKARIGVDIGGTFTDVVLEHGDELYTLKLLTQLEAPENGVREGVSRVLDQASLTYEDVGLVIHGTTLATNALIERKGARTAMITTEGFRDTIEMGTESRFDQYDIFLDKPKPLVPRRWRYPVPQRHDAQGREIMPLDEDTVRSIFPKLQEEKIESLAVCLLHAFVNPEHEQRIQALIQDEFPKLRISLSSEVSPEMREYERFSTTTANAYIQPVISAYLERLRKGLHDDGFRAPMLMMLSGGGLTSVETAVNFPIRLVESGPAGGAIFAADLAGKLDLGPVLSFDMGGTTAKGALVRDGRALKVYELEVARQHEFKAGSGLPLRTPVLDMIEIGAGGGSIASVDSLGQIRIGPHSAGSEPGPASYGRGGLDATVTDANVQLGRLHPDLPGDDPRRTRGRADLHPGTLALTDRLRTGKPGQSADRRPLADLRRFRFALRPERAHLPGLCRSDRPDRGASPEAPRRREPRLEDDHCRAEAVPDPTGAAGDRGAQRDRGPCRFDGDRQHGRLRQGVPRRYGCRDEPDPAPGGELRASG